MALMTRIPGMQTGPTVWNVILAIGYLICLTVVVVVAKTYRPRRGC